MYEVIHTISMLHNELDNADINGMNCKDRKSLLNHAKNQLSHACEISKHIEPTHDTPDYYHSNEYITDETSKTSSDLNIEKNTKSPGSKLYIVTTNKGSVKFVIADKPVNALLKCKEIQPEDVDLDEDVDLGEDVVDGPYSFII